MEFLGHAYNIYIGNSSHIPVDQYCCVQFLNCYNFLFQVSDEKIAIEKFLIQEANVEVDSEKFCNANDDQANYDGISWIIISLSIVLMLYRFDCCFYDMFFPYIFIPIKYESLYSAVFMCFIYPHRRNGIRL